MPEHLQRRGAVYYYCRRVPDDVRGVLGKDVIKKSLGTTSVKEAKRLRLLEDATWEARFDEMRGVSGAKQASSSITSKVTSSVLLAAARSFVARKDEQIATRLHRSGPDSEQERQEMAEIVEVSLSMTKNLDDPHGKEMIRHVAETMLGAGVFGPATPSVVSDEIRSVVRRALVELDKRRLAHLRGQHERRFHDALFDPDRPSMVTFGELADQWFQYKAEDAAAAGISRKNVDKQAAQVKLVKEIVGEHRPVRDLGYDECRSARGVLARVPANRSKLYAASSLNEALELARILGKPTLSRISQQQYLGALKDILQLGVKKRLLPSNPAEDLSPLEPDQVSPDEKRLPFTTDQLVGFFHSKYYRTCPRKAGRLVDPAGHQWRVWLPLMMLFLGLRPREILQLRVADVKRTPAGVWFLDVVASTDEDPDGDSAIYAKSLKTVASRRQVPLHSELIRIGFLQFVSDRTSSGKDQQMFPGLRRNMFGDPAWYPLKRFREVFIPAAIDLKPRQSVYSFRHTWRDALRRANASPDALKALGGWNEGTTTSDSYGSKLQPDLYAAVIEAVTYPQLDLSHLWAIPGAENCINKDSTS